MKNGEVLGVNAGQAIRYPVETKGRFVPVDINKWLGEHSINVPDVPHLDDTGAGEALHKN